MTVYKHVDTQPAGHIQTYTMTHNMKEKMAHKEERKAKVGNVSEK